MRLLDFFFPPRCGGCGRVGKYICYSCQKTMQLRELLCPECDRPAIDGMTHPGCLKPWGLDGLINVFRYTGVVKKVIKAIKYRFVSDMAEELVKSVSLTRYQSLRAINPDTRLYPIPLHQDRLRWRGFNQAEKLGVLLAEKLRIKMIEGLLIRKAKRAPQADISHRADRIKNAQGLFSSSPNLQVSNSPNLLLFDDVWTTGATMKEAAKVLKRSGVEKVWGMTIAR